MLVALLVQACVVGALAQTSQKSSTSAAQSAARVDVNSADLQTLETLPGVGPATAKRIVEGRPYKTLSDLENVKGLSKAKIDALKDKVTFGSAPLNQTTSAAKSSSPKHTATSSSTGASTASGGGASPANGSSGAAAKPRSTSGTTTSKIAPGQHVNINTASATELETLPGIGPTKAQAIIDYRNQNGSFKSIEDIEKVKGIKAGVFSKVKDYIKVSD
jgi:competence protein ComEA